MASFKLNKSRATMLLNRFTNYLRSIRSKPTFESVISHLRYIFVTVDSDSTRGINLQRVRLLGLPVLPAVVFLIAAIIQLTSYSYTLKGYENMYNKALFRHNVANVTTKLINERAVISRAFLLNKLKNFALRNGSCVISRDGMDRAIEETNSAVDNFNWLTWRPNPKEIDQGVRGTGVSGNNSENFRKMLYTFRYGFNGRSLEDCEKIYSTLLYIYAMANKLLILFLPDFYDVQLSKTTFLHVYALQHIMDAHEQTSVLCHLAFDKFYYGRFVDSSTEIDFMTNYSSSVDNLNFVKEFQLEIVNYQLKMINDTTTKVINDLFRYTKSITNSEIVNGSFAEWFETCHNFAKLNEYVKDYLIADEKAKGFYPEYIRCVSGIVIFSCALLILIPAFALIYNNCETTIKDLVQFSLLFNSQVKNLEEQKYKNEKLLYEMLPASVAKELRLGYGVNAEYFKSATIYFSDIVGFNDLVMSRTPISVINMLNSLFNLLDSIIDRFDVYKVETIGSVYMIVSGVPARNGNRHVAEIADISLEILQKLEKLNLQDSQTKMELKIGINTGPCVAGIVGNKMPRYCLFGDSINTASRMQSTGAASRIHLSEDTHKELKEFKHYNLKKRGTIEIKGKGMMTTYWLVGKEKIF